MDMICPDMKHFALAANTHEDPRHLSVIDVGTERHLLFDDFYIATGSDHTQYPRHIRWRYGPVEKHGRAIFEGVEPHDEGMAWFNVLREQGVYRLWYNACREGNLRVAYAESQDGLTFRAPPGLGKDNLVFDGGAASVGPEFGNVFIDPAGPANERYKMIYTDWPSAAIKDWPFTHNVGVLRGAASPDGVRWCRYLDNFYGRYCDSQNVALWDDVGQEYVAYCRVLGQYGQLQRGMQPVAGTGRGRCVGRLTSRDYRTWSAPEIVLAGDFDDGLNCDIYNSAFSHYPGAAHSYFMFPSLYRHYEGDFQVQVAVSRDQQHWLRPVRETWIPLGEDGEIDQFIIAVAPGFVPLDDDHLALYYRCGNLPHGGAGPVLPKEQLERREHRSRISRVVFKRDRMVGIEAGEDVGTFVTRPIRPKGGQLRLNMEPLARQGWVKVQLIDATTGDVIRGAGFEQCRPLTDDSLNGLVGWQDGVSALNVEGKAIRMHFQFQHTRLYAFQWGA